MVVGSHGPNKCGAPLAECPPKGVVPAPLELFALAPLEPSGAATLEVGYLPLGMGSAPLELA